MTLFHSRCTGASRHVQHAHQGKRPNVSPVSPVSPRHVARSVNDASPVGWPLPISSEYTVYTLSSIRVDGYNLCPPTSTRRTADPR